MTKKKQELLMAKSKIADNLNKVDQSVNDWTELACKTFDFACKAQDKFKNGSIEEKRLS